MSANSQLESVLREIEKGHGLPRGALTVQGEKPLENGRGAIYNYLEDNENRAMLEDWYEGNVPAVALRRAGLPEISQAIRMSDGATPLESPEIERLGFILGLPKTITGLGKSAAKGATNAGKNYVKRVQGPEPGPVVHRVPGKSWWEILFDPNRDRGPTV